ncbi:MAG: glycosyltransferase family 4 protein [SAR324 cluster bacterium]|nr:glycosyltransferase family 4 protein [SAR324 cluster bacterium]
MRICLIGYRGNPYSGGQGIYLYNLSRELARLGHEVEVIVGPPYPQPMDHWCVVHKLPNLNLWGRYGGQWLPRSHPLKLLEPWNLFDFAATRLRFFPEPFSFGFRAFAELRRLLETRRFDLLHDVQTLGYGVWAMKGYGMPVVTTVHHPLTVDRREAFARDRSFNERYHTAVFFPVTMQGFVIRRLTHVITASLAGKEAIMEDFRVAPERISIVPNGLDTETFHNPGCWKRRKNTLLFVGNTDDVKKGAGHLLQAMRKLPAGVRLRIVDDPYPAKTLIAGEVERLGLGKRVTFTGKLSEARLLEEYCRCTLLVQPSLYEGFGLPAAEAAACETPVVATEVGAVAEVVTPDTGVLVPPADARSLAGAVRELLGDPERRAALGRAGRRRMLHRFSWPGTARNTVRVYERVLAGQWAP